MPDILPTRRQSAKTPFEFESNARPLPRGAPPKQTLLMLMAVLRVVSRNLAKRRVSYALTDPLASISRRLLPMIVIPSRTASVAVNFAL